METRRACRPLFMMLALVVCPAPLALGQEATLVTYPAPEGADREDDFVVRVDGTEIFVYDCEAAAFAGFSFSGKVTVSVIPSKNADRVDIRPKNHGIAHSIKGRAVSFQLDRPCNLSVEINGNIKRPLFVFANPLEKDPPEPGDKNVRYFEEGESGLRNVENVRVVNTVLWNAEWGNAIEIGFELQTKKISGVMFKNCDIIHVERGGTFTIHNGDFARVENIRFEDIRVEDSRDKLIELRVGLSIYSADCPWEFARKNPQRKASPSGQWIQVGPDREHEYADSRGHIRNVRFKNIFVGGTVLPRSFLIGYNDSHSVVNVVVENLQFNGRRILNAEAGNFTIEKARRVRFVESRN